MNSVVYFVEATSFEQHSLWKEYHTKTEWEEIRDGFGEIIGEFGGKPIFLTFSFINLYGKLICFYNPISTVVNYVIIENYFKAKYVGVKTTDAKNFSDVINFCKIMKKQYIINYQIKDKCFTTCLNVLISESNPKNTLNELLSGIKNDFDNDTNKKGHNGNNSIYLSEILITNMFPLT